MGWDTEHRRERESRVRLGWQRRRDISCLHVSLERLCQEGPLAVTHLILVTHGIELLQLLGPVARLLLRDVCKPKPSRPGFWGPRPPPLGPGSVMWEASGEPQEWMEMEGQEARISGRDCEDLEGHWPP